MPTVLCLLASAESTDRNSTFTECDKMRLVSRREEEERGAKGVCV
jgi:hypothetical protein